MSEYTEGVCDDGAAILRDGEMVTISQVLHLLNSHETLITALDKVRGQYANQAKFADPDPASYFREFVRRIDAAISAAARQP